MANFEGLALPAYGAGVHYNESGTSNWTIEGDGRIAISISSTRPGTTTGMEIALSLSSTTPTTAYNLLLSRSSTKAATTDTLLGFSMGASAVGVSAISLAMGVASTLTNFLAVTSTNAPTYFLSLGASAGAYVASGFYSQRKTVAQSTISPYGALHCLVGTASFYIPMFHDTNTAAES